MQTHARSQFDDERQLQTQGVTVNDGLYKMREGRPNLFYEFAVLRHRLERVNCNFRRSCAAALIKQR
jgi:hypothetical protein